jgi:hypothetical protein
MQATNAPFFTPPRAEQWRRESAAVPTPPALPAPSWAYRLAMWALRAVFVLALLVVLAIWFFLFGEERPERVRPELTPAQRAAAFRLPHP